MVLLDEHVKCEWKFSMGEEWLGLDGAIETPMSRLKGRMMMKSLVVLIGLTVGLSAQTASSMSGTLKDTGGAPVAKALVTAYLQAKSTDGKFPPVFNTTTGSDGSFTFTGLVAGTYLLCAERPDIALLNPCFWAAKKTNATVPAGGSATGVSLVAEKGVAINIRVNDSKGLVSASPLLDDVIIAVKPTTGPGLPVRVAAKDGTGKTLTALVPQAQAVDVFIYSGKLVLADSKGTAFATPNAKVTVTAPTATAASQSSSQTVITPDVTINIQGQVQKP
jgi:hypothetical protein